jgi:hypothetical protein
MDTSSVVFTGYGIVAPATGQFPAYDAYANLDVTDKWVLMLRYMPENITPEHRQHLAAYASLSYKTMLARDHGAVSRIHVADDRRSIEPNSAPDWNTMVTFLRIRRSSSSLKSVMSSCATITCPLSGLIWRAASSTRIAAAVMRWSTTSWSTRGQR